MVDEALRTETLAAVKSIRQLGDRAANLAKARMEQGFEGMYTAALTSPRMVLVVCLIIAGMLGQVGLSFQDQIDDDVEIFLPDDAESTDLLLEVREEWSTDIAIIYIQTDNAKLGQGLGDNISDEAILREISWVEGDDENKNSGATSRGIDWNKNDRGPGGRHPLDPLASSTHQRSQLRRRTLQQLHVRTWRTIPHSGQFRL